MSRAALQDRIRWFSSPSDLRTPVVNLFSQVGELPAHFRILAVGMGFLLLARGARLDPHELLAQIIRMEKDYASAYAKQAAAMQQLAENELEC